MNKYKYLDLPADSAWDSTRFKWGRYVHWRIRYFFIGIWNIIRWMPTLYHDRDWDDYYITKILQKKIEFQRKHLVHANRHTGIAKDNRWMTILLNLLQKEHDHFYEDDLSNYYKSEIVMKPGDNNTYTLSTIRLWERYDTYLEKYPSTVRKVIKAHPGIETDKRYLAFLVSTYQQTKCRNLIFNILKNKSHFWWD